MKVFLDENACPIEYAHLDDAGIDLKTPICVRVPAHNRVFVDTGVHVEIPHGFAGLVVSKSGLNKNVGINVDGLIDEGYKGPIGATIHNHGDEPYTFLRGEKIAQLVIFPVNHVEIEYVKSLEEFNNSDRGESGFGSTGR